MFMRTPTRDNDENLPAREPIGKKPISRGCRSPSECVHHIMRFIREVGSPADAQPCHDQSDICNW